MCTSVTTSSGVIQSPNFPVDYGNDLDCVIKIEGSSAVKIEFTTFNLEDTYDFIYVSVSIPISISLLDNVTHFCFQDFRWTYAQLSAIERRNRKHNPCRYHLYNKKHDNIFYFRFH